MRIDTSVSGLVTVTLSRRNLLALLHKVDMPGSARLLAKYPEDEQVLYVRVEPDHVHYADPEVAIGRMHPDTEAFIDSVGQFATGYVEGQYRLLRGTVQR